MQRPEARANAPLKRPQAIFIKIQPRLLEQKPQKALFILRERRHVLLAAHARIVRERKALPDDRASEGNVTKLRRPGRERLAIHFNRHVPSPRSEIPTILVLGHYFVGAGFSRPPERMEDPHFPKWLASRMAIVSRSVNAVRPTLLTPCPGGTLQISSPPPVARREFLLHPSLSRPKMLLIP